MALTGFEPSRPQLRRSLSQTWSQLRSRVLGAEHVLVQRLAGTVFLIRVASALLAFVSQVLLARWMGSFQFGIYVYVWTWVQLLGQAIDLGLGTAAQRFIPQYREHGLIALLRGFVSGSRWAALGIAIAIAALAAGCVHLVEPWLEDYMAIPLYLACIVIPAYALANVQQGIARSYDWVGLSMMPVYVVRQALLMLLMGAAYLLQLPMNSVTAMLVTAVSVWLPTIGQLLMVNRRLTTRIERGPKAYDFKLWLATALPILMVGGFYSLLAYSDVLVLQHFRPPDEVAVYYATVKTLALVSLTPYRRQRRIASAPITSPAIARAWPPSCANPSSSHSGRRSPPRLCCSFADGRSLAYSALSSLRVITSSSFSPWDSWRELPSDPSSDCSICLASNAFAPWSISEPSRSISVCALLSSRSSE